MAMFKILPYSLLYSDAKNQKAPLYSNGVPIIRWWGTEVFGKSTFYTRFLRRMVWCSFHRFQDLGNYSREAFFVPMI